MALYNANSSVVLGSDGSEFQLTGTTGVSPPAGPQGLGWLLVAPIA